VLLIGVKSLYPGLKTVPTVQYLKIVPFVLSHISLIHCDRSIYSDTLLNTLRRVCVDARFIQFQRNFL